MRSHSHNLWNDGFVCPFNTEDFSQFLEVVCCCFTDRENRITQPAHAESRELLIEELNTQLACQERNVLDDGQSNSPLLVFCKLDNSRKEGLRKEVDANYFVC